MTAAVPAALVLGMVCLTMSGCGDGGPTGPPTPQEAWDLYRDAFERRSIDDLLALWSGREQENLRTHYHLDWPEFLSPVGGFDRYERALSGMDGPPSIIGASLDLDGSEPHVAFVWNGPGVDIAAEMIAWDERNLVKWHSAFIQKNQEYGTNSTSSSVKARATGVHAARIHPTDAGFGMSRGWEDGDMDAVMSRFGDDSKLLAFVGGRIEEFVDITGIRSFFEANTNDFQNLYNGFDSLPCPTFPPPPQCGSIMTGINYDDFSQPQRLVWLVHSPDWQSIKHQVVVAYNLSSTAVSYVV